MTSGEVAASPPAPALSLVVSTVGRAAAFRRLLQSLVESSAADRIELVLVDQSPGQVCAQVLAERPWDLRWQATTSGLGASVGRNAGLRLATAPILGFPDDNAWYPPQTITAALARFEAGPHLAGVCGRQTTPDGRDSMLRWSEAQGPVTRRNFLRTSIASTMLFRRAWLDRVGDFDVDLGVGTHTWYGACEESDLLLRVLEAGGSVWYDPRIKVLQDEPRDDPDERFVAKMLSYGCGQGRLWRQHALPRWQLGWYCGRKLGAAVVRTAHGQRTLARADLAWARGNVAGFRGVPPPALAHLAAARPLR